MATLNLPSSISGIWKPPTSSAGAAVASGAAAVVGSTGAAVGAAQAARIIAAATIRVTTRQRFLTDISYSSCLADGKGAEGLDGVDGVFPSFRHKPSRDDLQDNEGSGLAFQGAFDVLWIGDQRLLAALLQELNDSLDLRAHTALGEVTFRQIALGLRQRQSVEPLLIGLVIPPRHLLHGGRDQEQVGLQARRQQRSGEVLVDDGFHAGQVAAFALDDRDTPAAGTDHDEPGLDQAFDGRLLDDLLGDGRGHHPAPAASGVFHDGPAILLAVLPG